MTKLIFWDVDTSYDFVRSDGKLYVPGSEEIIPALERLTDFAHSNRIPIVASADDHDLADPEISATPDWKRTFPPHCMRGTPGAAKIEQTELHNPLVITPELQDPVVLTHQVQAHSGDFLLLKQSFDVFTNANVPTVLGALAPESIVLYGVATDYCNKYAVEGILRLLPQSTLYLVTDAIRAINTDDGDRLLERWSQRGVRMLTVDAIVKQKVLDFGLARV
jgi:nicotinamidase/pyrazinamidase